MIPICGGNPMGGGPAGGAMLGIEGAWPIARVPSPGPVSGLLGFRGLFERRRLRLRERLRERERRLRERERLLRERRLRLLERRLRERRERRLRDRRLERLLDFFLERLRLRLPRGPLPGPPGGACTFRAGL